MTKKIYKLIHVIWCRLFHHRYIKYDSWIERWCEGHTIVYCHKCGFCWNKNR